MTNEEYKIILDSICAAVQDQGTICGRLFPKPVCWDAERMELVAEFHTDEQMANPVGGLHGGMIAMIFDNALGTLAACFAADAFAPTATMNVEYLRPVPAVGSLYVRGKIVKLGRSLIHLRGELLDTPGSNKPFAVASAIFCKTERKNGA